MKNKKWIQGAVSKHKAGSLHRQLGITPGNKIPVSLTSKIKSAEIGSTIKNPTKTGKRNIHVTTLMKRRAVLANTLRGLKHRR